MYSTKSALAKEVCEKIGFIFEIHFVSVMTRMGRIYVRGTCGKPHEFIALRKACDRAGYIYVGCLREDV